MRGEILEVDRPQETRPLTLEEELRQLLSTSDNWDIGSFRGTLKGILDKRAKGEVSMCREAAPPPEPRREWKEFKARHERVFAQPHPTNKKIIVCSVDGILGCYDEDDFDMHFEEVR